MRVHSLHKQMEPTCFVKGRITAAEAPSTCIGFSMPLSHLRQCEIHAKDVTAEISGDKLVVKLVLRNPARHVPHTTWTMTQVDAFPPAVLRERRNWRVDAYEVMAGAGCAAPLREALRLAPNPAAVATMVKFPVTTIPRSAPQAVRPVLSQKRTLLQAAVNDDGDGAEPAAKRRRTDAGIPPLAPVVAQLPATTDLDVVLGGETEEDVTAGAAAVK